MINTVDIFGSLIHCDIIMLKASRRRMSNGRHMTVAPGRVSRIFAMFIAGCFSCVYIASGHSILCRDRQGWCSGCHRTDRLRKHHQSNQTTRGIQPRTRRGHNLLANILVLQSSDVHGQCRLTPENSSKQWRRSCDDNLAELSPLAAYKINTLKLLPNVAVTHVLAYTMKQICTIFWSCACIGDTFWSF